MTTIANSSAIHPQTRVGHVHLKRHGRDEATEVWRCSRDRWTLRTCLAKTNRKQGPRPFGYSATMHLAV